MKHYLLSGLLTLALAPSLMAQHQIGLTSSNLAGVNGVYWNPASIAGSRVKTSINLLNLDVHATNNYIRYDGPNTLLQAVKNDTPLEEEYLARNLNGEPKSFSAGLDLRGPGVMFALGNRHSVALTSRVRGFIQGNNVAEDVAELFFQDLEEAFVQDVPYQDQHFALDLNLVREYALSYGFVALKTDRHVLKTGLTVKRLGGMYSAQAQIRDFDFTYKEDINGEGYLQVDNLDMRVAYLEKDVDELTEDLNTVLQEVLRPTGRGWGADLGVVYELFPASTQATDKEGKLLTPTDLKGKYRLRVGASLMDLGGITYSNQVKGYDFKRQNVQLSEADFDDADVEEYGDVIEEEMNITPAERLTSFRSGLPTSLNLNVDYRMSGKLYLNLAFINGLRGQSAVGMRTQNIAALTPRLETKVLTLAIPMYLYNGYSDFAYGAMVRVGPLVVGSDNLTGVIGSGNFNSANAYVGLVLQVLEARKDKKPKKEKVKKVKA